MVAMGPDELNAFLAAAFPDSNLTMRVTRADEEGVEIVWPYHHTQLRPGGTISGPTLMTLADTVAYVAVVSRIGAEFLTVTSHLAIDFLRKPPAADLRATGEVLKLGRRQASVVDPDLRHGRRRTGGPQHQRLRPALEADRPTRLSGGRAAQRQICSPRASRPARSWMSASKYGTVATTSGLRARLARCSASRLATTW